jgi:tetratricopeptide (TPR) repeat protein
LKDIFKILTGRVLLLLLLIPVAVDAQILRDASSLSIVEQCVSNVYNLKFNDARECNKKLNIKYPGHPVMYLLDGMITYWENFPILPTSPARTSYENDMRKCIELCEGKKDPADEPEFLLANLSARGMLLLFYTDNDLSKEAFPLAVSTYKYIRRSFDYTDTYNDFYFFTGIYNYYRVAYPEAYPAYKPLAMLFPKGDKQRGINDLHTAATNSILFKAEASSFLSLICLSFENNYEQAFDHSKYLHELYPSNIMYLSIFIRNLLLLKQYDEAEEHIKLLDSTSNNSYFRAQLLIYNGILQEKKYHNYLVAEKDYLKGISDLSAFGYFGNEFAAFGYFGLSRISEKNNRTDNSKTYRKKALELAEFDKVNFN